ncbi:MAG: hypothetical protein JNL58_27395 [Planctomyces sp.]|nr:hypothetical protein [Planctomyces sp.]
MEAQQLRRTLSPFSGSQFNGRLRFGLKTGVGVCIALWTLVSGVISGALHAATFQTRNFSVSAETPEIAEQVGQSAEAYRHDLAIFWLGKPLPNWSKPCRIRVREGVIGAGGQTTFQFSGGEVFNWNMYVQGTLERILDSVLPHEINHTIFACHFRRPLPRWADEGAATLFEDRSEQLKQLAILNEVIRNDEERFSLQKLMSMKEYPTQHRPMLVLYAQGYALVDFLIQQKGRQTYLRFLADGEKHGWEEAIRRNFDHEGVASLEKNWQGWVLAGMPSLVTPKTESVAAASSGTETRLDRRSAVRAAGMNSGAVRAQSPDSPQVAAATGPTPSRSANVSDSGSSRVRQANPQATGTNTAAAGSGLQEAADAHKRIPRRATIEAPKPEPKNSIAGTEAAVPQSGVGTPASPVSVDESSDNAPFFSDTLGSVEDAQSRNDRERSAVGEITSEAVDIPGRRSLTNDRPSSLMSTSTEFETQDAESLQQLNPSQKLFFESVHLPRERNEVSGSTPQWAGFPGQKQSF